MAHLEYSNPTLNIEAQHGILRIDHGGFDYTFVYELPLDKLMKIYPKWQTLVKILEGDLPSMYMGNPKVRKEVDSILKAFGIPSRKLTFNQIEALLFYEELDGKYQPSLLWRFHNVYPKSLSLPSNEPEIDHSEHMDLDVFEMASLYLLQEGKEHLIKEWPLSRIMKLMSAKSFLTWLAYPENKALLFEKQSGKKVDQNPTDPEELKKSLEKRMFGKG